MEELALKRELVLVGVEHAWKSAGPSSSCRRRSRVDTNGIPKSENSRAIQPEPKPGMIRPPAMLSTVAIILPVCAGLRMPTGVTSVPISGVAVTAAMPAARVQASSMGMAGDCGPYRWSLTQSESKPISSKRSPHAASPARSA